MEVSASAKKKKRRKGADTLQLDTLGDFIFLSGNEEKGKRYITTKRRIIHEILPFKNIYIFVAIQIIDETSKKGITKIFQKGRRGNIINKTKILAGLIECSFRSFSLPLLLPPRLGFKITSSRDVKIDAVSIINPFPNEMPFCTVFIR